MNKAIENDFDKKKQKNKKEENFLKISLMMGHSKRFGKVNVMLPYYMWYRFVLHNFLSLFYNFFLFFYFTKIEELSFS